MLENLFTWRTLAIITGVSFLFLLGHYFPRKRIYAIFLTLLGITAIAVYVLTPEVSQPISPAERQERLEQQQLVADWHAKYQKTIDLLDHTWKQYHLVLRDFAEDNIDLEEAHQRLTRLDRLQTRTTDILTAAEPPAGLLTENYDLVLAVIQKTRAYAAAQQRTIHLSALSSDPDKQLSELPAEQSRLLQEIMLREAPPGLFTAAEISALRDNVHVPE